MNAYLDDYAFLAAGLIELHRATADPRWLEAAEQVTKTQIERFWDAESGGFFYTSDDHEELLARSKDPVDSALPSGNSVAAGTLVYLGHGVCANPRNILNGPRKRSLVSPDCSTKRRRQCRAWSSRGQI